MKYLARTPLYLSALVGFALLIGPGREDSEPFAFALAKLGGGLAFVGSVGFLLVLGALDRLAARLRVDVPVPSPLGGSTARRSEPPRAGAQ